MAQEEHLVCARFIDGNGISQTITADEKLKDLERVDFTQKQPYKKMLRLFSKRRDNGQKCILTTYHPNNHLWQYLEGADLVANGRYLEYYPGGQKKIEAFVIAGPCDLTPSAITEWKFEGISYVYNENEEKIAEIPYLKGELHGVAKYFFSNGKLEKTISYQRGHIHGEVNSFYSNGTLKLKEHYENDLLNGPTLGYFEGEQPCFIEQFQNGQLIQGIYYDRSGSVLSVINDGFGKKAVYKNGYLYQLQEYKNGLLEGEISLFLPTGELKVSYHWKNGQKNGEEIEYYLFSETSKSPKKKQPKLSIQWKNGQIDGMIKSWYENGVVESQKEMVQNKKNGHTICWYNDSSLLCMEEYENDLLVEGKYFKKGDREPISYIKKGEGVATLYDGKTGQFIRKIAYANGRPQL